MSITIRRPMAAVLLAASAALAGCAATATDRTAGRFIDDGALTGRVKTALVRDAARVATEVNVTTYRGVVQLSGFVDSEAEKSQAAQVARNVQGVETLHNDLRVKPRDR